MPSRLRDPLVLVLLARTRRCSRSLHSVKFCSVGGTDPAAALAAAGARGWGRWPPPPPTPPFFPAAALSRHGRSSHRRAVPALCPFLSGFPQGAIYCNSLSPHLSGIIDGFLPVQDGSRKILNLNTNGSRYCICVQNVGSARLTGPGRPAVQIDNH